MGVVYMLILNFALLAGIIFLLWRYACVIGDVSFIDAFWGFGMVLMAWSSWLFIGMPGGRALLLLCLTSLWGMRLSVHLIRRWRAEGPDARYARIIGGQMEAKRWSWNKSALLMVFALQAPLLFITCLPAQLGIMGQVGAGDIGLLAIIGTFAAGVGIAFETIGDAQLHRFKRDPNNTGKVLDTGLWRYTRHPNYFGDFLTWWGIWLIAAQAGMWVALASIIGPIFLSFTLMKWSGAPLLERGLKKRRTGYEDYIRRTSGFFPWPPRS